MFSLKSGTHFKGWNTVSNATGKYINVGTSLQSAGITGDITLYAIWENHNYLIYSYTNAKCTTNWETGNDHVPGCTCGGESDIRNTTINVYNSSLTSYSTVTYTYHKYCTWNDAKGCGNCSAAKNGTVNGCSAADRWGTVYKKCSICDATTSKIGAP